MPQKCSFLLNLKFESVEKDNPNSLLQVATRTKKSTKHMSCLFLQLSKRGESNFFVVGTFFKRVEGRHVFCLEKKQE